MVRGKASNSLEEKIENINQKIQVLANAISLPSSADSHSVDLLDQGKVRELISRVDEYLSLCNLDIRVSDISRRAGRKALMPSFTSLLNSHSLDEAQPNPHILYCNAFPQLLAECGLLLERILHDRSTYDDLSNRLFNFLIDFAEAQELVNIENDDLNSEFGGRFGIEQASRDLKRSELIKNSTAPILKQLRDAENQWGLEANNKRLHPLWAVACEAAARTKQAELSEGAAEQDRESSDKSVGRQQALFRAYKRRVELAKKVIEQKTKELSNPDGALSFATQMDSIRVRCMADAEDLMLYSRAVSIGLENALGIKTRVPKITFGTRDSLDLALQWYREATDLLNRRLASFHRTVITLSLNDLLKVSDISAKLKGGAKFDLASKDIGTGQRAVLMTGLSAYCTGLSAGESVSLEVQTPAQALVDESATQIKLDPLKVRVPCFQVPSPIFPHDVVTSTSLLNRTPLGGWLVSYFGNANDLDRLKDVCLRIYCILEN